MKERFGSLEMEPVNEASRVYVYPDGHRQGFTTVTHFATGNTTHRLRLESGRFVIVQPGWDYLELELPEGWSL